VSLQPFHVFLQDAPFPHVVDYPVNIYAGEAPFMSRNRADMTCPFLHASLTVFVSMCSKLVVVHPGLVLKWFAGRMSCCLHMVMMSSIWQLLSSWASPSDSTMGHQCGWCGVVWFFWAFSRLVFLCFTPLLGVVLQCVRRSEEWA